MTSDEIRSKYINFFKSAPKSHKEISSAPLVPPDDPTTLFTSSGMQQLIPYLTGDPHPEGKRLANSQPCLRLEDMDEVGDNRHTTFFEMLGNWSLGDYFKKEQLEWFWEFLTKELKLPKEKLWVSVFKGTKEVPKDEESANIWEKIGVSKERIHFYGVKENWWSRSGPPDKMPTGEIGGPDSEVFFEFTQIKHDPKYGKECHPNCECGRFLEIGNSVFIEYIKKEDGSLKELPQKNVDFGGGLERMTAAVNNNPDIFEIDSFKPTIEVIEKETGIKYGTDEKQDRSFRIIADHFRASSKLFEEGVEPSNKLQGYILRRLIRSAALRVRELSGDISTTELSRKISSKVNNVNISTNLEREVDSFMRVLGKGVQLVTKNSKIQPFDLYQTYGIPFEVTQEIFFNVRKKKLTEKDREKFEKKLEKHQKLSRTASAGMFKGGLADSSKEVTRLHTTTHLLHASLRKVLGEHIQQKGSNITSERLRFDFTHQQKLTGDELKKVEELVNKQIQKNLSVNFEVTSLEKATKEGALAFFGEKYDQKVKVYTVGDPNDEWFSKEVCGGPHVSSTSEIGHANIFRQEKIGAGIMRLYVKLE
ncbi:alanine--tRNA ligase [Candidatus Woesebacteria bacterium]|nr:MAG: alanine--tRNA ligase [Candidatus Woesebacteria bacterium]